MKENADNVSAEKKHMIDVVHLSKHFGDLVVLDDISDTVYEGEKVCIIGPSGSGKSTYLRCLNVLEDPTSGKVIFDGEDLCDLKVDINLHRQKMGMVFQQFNLFNNMTVKTSRWRPCISAKRRYGPSKEKISLRGSPMYSAGRKSRSSICRIR